MASGNRALLALAIGALTSGCAGPRFTGHPSLDPTPEISDGVAHRVGTFPGFDGLPLYAQSWMPAQGAPKAALVVVHGLKDYGGRYRMLGESLARDGYAVWAFDLRGHGNSPGRRVLVSSFDDYVEDLDLFLRRVHLAAGGRPVFLFGHSMGGAIVVSEVLQRHPPVNGVILSGAALRHDLSSFTEASVRALGSLFPRLALLSLDDDGFSRDPAVVAAMHVDPLIYDGAGPARTAGELLAAIDQIQEHMEEVDVPLLILHGAADRITPPWGSWQLYARASSSDKTLQWYSGDFHDLLHEPDRARVLADIQRWLDARVEGSGDPSLPAEPSPAGVAVPGSPEAPKALPEPQAPPAP